MWKCSIDRIGGSAGAERLLSFDIDNELPAPPGDDQETNLALTRQVKQSKQRRDRRIQVRSRKTHKIMMGLPELDHDNLNKNIDYILLQIFEDELLELWRLESEAGMKEHLQLLQLLQHLQHLQRVQHLEDLLRFQDLQHFYLQLQHQREALKEGTMSAVSLAIIYGCCNFFRKRDNMVGSDIGIREYWETKKPAGTACPGPWA